MHLFFFHLFTDIDTLTPIIKLIGKEKTIISNINILNNHSNQNLIKYLKSEKFNFEDYFFLNYRGYIFLLIIKI